MIAHAVSNSTVLIVLERIGHLDLLPKLVGRLDVPEAVLRETGVHADWLHVRSVQNRSLIAALRTQVDEGEAEAIALAAESPGSVLLLDEKKARRIASEMKVPVVGTVGLIVRAKRARLVPSCQGVLDAMIAADFRMTEALYREALRLAGEA